MAANLKKEIQVPVADVSDLMLYTRLDSEIKALEKAKAEVAGRIKLTVTGLEGYDFGARYNWGNIIRTSHRVENSLDQLATYKAMKSPKLRDLLFPSAVAFKPGSDKPLAEAHGLLLRQWGENPVIEVIKR
jgi:hypothetical protein